MARVGARINELVRFKSKSWLGAESNRRHVDFQSTALPTELPSRKSRVSLSSNAGWSLKQKTLNAQPASAEVAVAASLPGSAVLTSLARTWRAPEVGVYSFWSLEFPRQFDCPPQQVQIMVSRNLDAAELLQMRREPLRIEQCKFPDAQILDKRHQRDFRCVGHAMKHRFTKKDAADRHAVESAGELATGRVRPTGGLAVSPRFNRMRVTELMEPDITLDNFAIDPCVFTRRAGLDHVRKGSIDFGFKNFLAQETSQRMRHMKILQRQDRTRIGREPFDCAILHRHRKNTEPIAL